MNVALTREWVNNINSAVGRNQVHLTRLDSPIGDGDHGVNMARGFARACGALTEPAESVGGLLVTTGTLLVSGVGGASGPLYGSALRAMGKAVGCAGEVGTAQFATALQAGLEKIRQLGAAVPGDKTMIDAYAPAVTAFRDTAEAGGCFHAAARAAADAAEAGMRKTIPMQARKGRASYLGLRSIGHQDPGATSTAYVFRALADTLEAR